MKDIKNIILEKVFRKKENWKKVQYIVKNTSLTLPVIVKASNVARANDYHNFGHQIGATEMAIRIAKAEELGPEVIDVIALSMLFHDASHRGIVQRYDEMRAVDAMEMVITSSDVTGISQSFDKIMTTSRDLILATTFTNRGKTSSLAERIVQDADLAHLGLGPIYWPWASMGLVDEFARQEGRPLSAVEFIRNRQEKFIQYLQSLNGGQVYLTKGAQSIFNKPQDDLPTVLAYNDKQIQFAYDVRKDDITLHDFKIKLLALA